MKIEEFQQEIENLNQAKENYIFWKGLERTPPTMKDLATTENAYQQYINIYIKLLKEIEADPTLAMLHIVGPVIGEATNELAQ